MAKRLTLRILIALGTIFIIISLSFLLIRLMPGNTLMYIVGQEEYYYLLDYSPETLEEISAKYGLNEPLIKQYAKYLISIVKLDFGESYTNHRPVLQTVLTASKWTLMLSIPTLILSGLLGGVCSMLSGWKPGGIFDKISTPAALLLNTIPSNCMGIILLIILAYKIRIFPVSGMVSAGVQGVDRIINILWHMLLPLIVLVSGRGAGNYMLMKSTVSSLRREEYALTAKSKGLPSRIVLFRHVLRNAMPPYLASICLQIGSLLSGATVVEVVFGWKGMGSTMYNAVQSCDYPTLQLCFLISGVMVVLGTLLADVLNNMLDPRLKEEMHE